MHGEYLKPDCLFFKKRKKYSKQPKFFKKGIVRLSPHLLGFKCKIPVFSIINQPSPIRNYYKDSSVEQSDRIKVNKQRNK